MHTQTSNNAVFTEQEVSMGIEHILAEPLVLSGVKKITRLNFIVVEFESVATHTCEVLMCQLLLLGSGVTSHPVLKNLGWVFADCRNAALRPASAWVQWRLQSRPPTIRVGLEKLCSSDS